MAICKMCHRTVPAGVDFCEECESRRKAKAEEDYLESLLNAFNTSKESRVREDHAPISQLNNNITAAQETESAPELVVVEKKPDISIQDEGELIPEFETETETAPENEAETNAEINSEINAEIIAEPNVEPIFITENLFEEMEQNESVDAAETPLTETLETESLETESLLTESFETETLVTESLETETPEAETLMTEEEAEPNIEDLLSAFQNDIPEVLFPEADGLDTAAEGIENLEIPFESNELPAENIEDGNGVIPEVDDMLSDLLADLDSVGFDDGAQEPVEPIDPDDLSAIFEEAQANEESSLLDDLFASGSEPEPETTDTTPSDTGLGMSQADIDALLGNVSTPEPEPETTDTTPSDTVSSDTGLGMSQADIDALLGNVSIPEPEPEKEEADDTDLMDLLARGNEELDSIELPDFSEVEVTDSTGTSDDITELSQDDLDAMFIDITASPDPTGDEDNLSDNTTEYKTEQDLENLINSDDSDVDLDRIMDEISSGDFEKKLEDISDKTEEKPKKKSWFQRLFGNIVEELTPEEIEERKRKALEEEEKKKQQALDKEAKKKLSKEEAAEKKKQEKAEAAEAKKAKDEAAKKKKEEAKEKARKKKEAKAALEELEVDEGRINRAGATILFVLFAIITVFIIVGTNIYSYNLSIQNAQEDFDRKRYNEAYYEVYGLEIKDEDIELYDRIMTVMYVNTQLNAYNNYMKVGDSEKAVDSLIKGLQRYDKYLQLATMLDINEDLDYVRQNILTELEQKFNIDAEQAAIMVAMDDQIDYTENIYNLLGTYEGSGIE